MRSLIEPVRRIVAKVHGHFIKGIAEDVDFSEKLVEVSAYGPDGQKQSFYLPYDKLIVGVGMSFRELPCHSELNQYQKGPSQILTESKASKIVISSKTSTTRD